MKIYFSVVHNKDKELKKLMIFLQKQGHIVYRAPYIFSEDSEELLQKELGLNRKTTFLEQRDAHLKWVDDSDLLIADISMPSDGRSMIIQRALDKPAIGLPRTPIILIKKKSIERTFGRLIKGVLENEDVTYFEYDNVEEVFLFLKDHI